ncbi:hypothetical protein QCN29_24925 [Streptomyces sp. HNM0663]|uniref:Transmembrane protein n=1 Tax=Streptomyces chengmaiensis TaxID=3040919 RepID=A0ABT6HTC6_9ACTN|nr:hypothetical protein [Streptomyces chengmaiensis]MDH2391965.1 hypothetical protein [Streptomyces chengmaiensis]
MEAGPRDTEQQRRDAATRAGDTDSVDRALDVHHADRGMDGVDGLERTGGDADTGPRLSPDGPDEQDLIADEVEVELRPQRRLRIWQLAPIVMLAALGSLMFAFPLAFGSGDGGAVVAMLGLLISCCAAGWGVMAARKVGHTWPGLPPRGSGERPDWRVLALYVCVAAALVALAVWRVARLR